MTSPMIRFAFVVGKADESVLFNPGWRVWCHGEDTYITSKSVGAIWKASLHGDAAWRVAVTKENIGSSNPVLPPMSDRAPWKFAPTSFIEGRRLAFVIGVTRAAFLPAVPGSKEVLIEAQDNWNWLTTARVWMTDPGIAIDGPNLVGGPLELTSGRRVWVDAASEEILGMASDPQPQASGALVKVQTPEADGVSAPGYLVTGLFISK